MSWPSNLPDLNPMENIWAYVVNKMKKYENRSFYDYLAQLRVLFNNIPERVYQRNIDSMTKRL